MILIIVYTKVKTGSFDKSTVTESNKTVETAAGPASLLLSDRINNTAAENAGGGDSQNAGADRNGAAGAEQEDEEAILGPAEKMNLDKALRTSYGLAIELDYVSASRISFHGTFGYMAFALNSSESGEIVAELESAVTFEELGGLTMGGAARTDVLGGDGCALIVPGIHNQEIARRRKFLYIEETNEITGGIVAPDWMMKKVAQNDFTDTIVEEEHVDELKALIKENGGGKLLYGPVTVPESDSNLYGFLTESGENLRDVWYGLWNRDLGTITRIPLFES